MTAFFDGISTVRSIHCPHCDTTWVADTDPPTQDEIYEMGLLAAKHLRNRHRDTVRANLLEAYVRAGE